MATNRQITEGFLSPLRIDFDTTQKGYRARAGDGSGQRGGTFTSLGRQAQQSYNKNFALNMRAKLGVMIQNHIEFGKRPQASTGRLHRISIDEGNSESSNNFVGVGNAKFLDKSEAKYWRTFEYGSAATWKHPFVGTQLYPVKFGENKWGGLSDLRTDTGGPTGPGAIGRGNAPFNLDRFVVKHEIAPAHIYADLVNAEKTLIQGHSAQWAARYLNKYLQIEDVIAGKGFLPPAVD